jgi:hypothetical protein
MQQCKYVAMGWYAARLPLLADATGVRLKGPAEDGAQRVADIVYLACPA